MQIQIASGSCKLYTRRELLSQPVSTANLPSKQNTNSLLQTINRIEYQVSPFALPGFNVDVHYKTQHSNTSDPLASKRGSVHCRAMIQSPTTELSIHPILIDFLGQTLEHVRLPNEYHRREQSTPTSQPRKCRHRSFEHHVSSQTSSGLHTHCSPGSPSTSKRPSVRFQSTWLSASPFNRAFSFSHVYRPIR